MTNGEGNGGAGRKWDERNNIWKSDWSSGLLTHLERVIVINMMLHFDYVLVWTPQLRHLILSCCKALVNFHSTLNQHVPTYPMVCLCCCSRPSGWHTVRTHCGPHPGLDAYCKVMKPQSWFNIFWVHQGTYFDQSFFFCGLTFLFWRVDGTLGVRTLLPQHRLTSCSEFAIECWVPFNAIVHLATYPFVHLLISLASLNQLWLP